MEAVGGILCDEADNIWWETSWAVSLDIILIVIVSPSTLPQKKENCSEKGYWVKVDDVA